MANLKSGSSPRAVAQTICHPNASLKRIAWAFGCAKKGSDEERQLRDLLVAKVKEGSPQEG